MSLPADCGQKHAQLHRQPASHPGYGLCLERCPLLCNVEVFLNCSRSLSRFCNDIALRVEHADDQIRAFSSVGMPRIIDQIGTICLESSCCSTDKPGTGERIESANGKAKVSRERRSFGKPVR